MRPLIISCKEVSNSNRIVYTKFNQLPQSSSSLLVLSTIKGVMTHKEAWIQHLGGIILFKVV